MGGEKKPQSFLLEMKQYCLYFAQCSLSALITLLSLQVFNAYQAGVGALKLSMKDVTVEKAESLVDQIQEVQEGVGGHTYTRQFLRTEVTLSYLLLSQTVYLVNLRTLSLILQWGSITL